MFLPSKKYIDCSTNLKKADLSFHRSWLSPNCHQNIANSKESTALHSIHFGPPSCSSSLRIIAHCGSSNGWQIQYWGDHHKSKRGKIKGGCHPLEQMNLLPPVLWHMLNWNQSNFLRFNTFPAPHSKQGLPSFLHECENIWLLLMMRAKAKNQFCNGIYGTLLLSSVMLWPKSKTSKLVKKYQMSC